MDGPLLLLLPMERRSSSSSSPPPEMEIEGTPGGWESSSSGHEMLIFGPGPESSSSSLPTLIVGIVGWVGSTITGGGAGLTGRLREMLPPRRRGFSGSGSAGGIDGRGPRRMLVFSGDAGRCGEEGALTDTLANELASSSGEACEWFAGRVGKSRLRVCSTALW